ncbi:hypothetical protein PTTG_01908 [Puccinia triticina 1-1 BBBD Race 1]|uniref:Uncharacterized protein n=1 Tax=Puccinia triticina (isolate 1-1 / race 1 (BBBD)) TaxID=630390 RepID=A0A180GZZ5_PUCT1|nr:hypothetical protein PTTG_01908 [Puccinia triticina 1-1 BBBD Race 1]
MMEVLPSFEEFQAGPPRTDADVEKLAKKQLAPFPIPEGYLSQLRAHLKEFPDDFWFRLTPHAGNGFGTIRCLEPGCSSHPIALKPRTKRADGGRSVGVGGLSEFQQHIFDHDHHESLRDYRVSQWAARKSSSAQPTVHSAMPIRHTSKASDSKPSHLSLDDDTKPSHPTSTSRSQSTSSKRGPSSPPISPRHVKRANATPGRSSTANKTSRVIDLVSSDDNMGRPRSSRTSNPSPSKGPSQIVDVDTSDGDSDLKILNVKSFGKQGTPIEIDEAKPTSFRASSRAIDVDELASSSDEDIKWMKTQGLVPMKNQPRASSASTSRLSAAILNDATPRAGRSSSSLVDRKPGMSPHIPADDKPTPRSRLDAAMGNSAYERMIRHLAGEPSPSGSTKPDVKPRALPTGVPNLFPSFPQPQAPAPSTSASAAFKREQTVHPFASYGGQQAFGSPFLADQKPVPQASTSASAGFKREPTAPVFGAYGGLASSSPFAVDRPQDRRGIFDTTDDSSSEDEDERRLDMMASASQLIFPQLFGSNAIRPGERMPYLQPDFRPEETHEFLKQAVTNMDFTNNATVAEARLELGLVEGEEPRLDGLSVLLMPHQVIGTAWMIKQEKSKNMGGILGDEMGLGKTIQMIATMVKNRSTDPKIKGTLILAPLALLTQWKEEIAERSTCDLSVLIYHSSAKVADRKKVSNYDVVITTLDTLRGDWYDDEVEEVDSTKKPRGLYKIEWYRVVIDEAQIIRNRKSKKSRAVCALKSIYRWCLTGTPIFNTLWDIYPYLRFLRIRPYNDHHRFRDHITVNEKKRPNLATSRAQAVLGTCMLRRQKNSKLDGKPLIVLPPKHEEDVWLDMSPDEREIYEMLEKHAQQKFNVFLRRGTVLKNFACILVLLLRLRQACGHPSLAIEEDDSPINPEDSADPEYADPDSELKRAIGERGQTWVDNVKKKFQEEADELVKAEQQNRSEAAVPECPICNDALDDTSRVTQCGHVFCEACLDTLMMQQRGPMEDDSNTDPSRIPKPCPNCRAPFRRIDTYLKKAFVPPADVIDDDDSDLPDSGITVRHKMRNGILDDSDDDGPSEKGKEKIARSEFVPSTKLVWLLERIEEIKKECPTDKIIVVSQWTSMLHICGTFLRERGLRYVSYQGDMNTLERNMAVSNFKKKPEYSIMLMSLKCGGVGLNLTCANRVVSLDLAWSPASEKQAFDRAHRFGQEKPVFVKRVMLTKTVEERIVALQKGKQDITDSTLGEGTGKKLKRMTVSELAALFNLNTRGEVLD